MDISESSTARASQDSYHDADDNGFWASPTPNVDAIFIASRPAGATSSELIPLEASEKVLEETAARLTLNDVRMMSMELCSSKLALISCCRRRSILTPTGYSRQFQS